MKHTQSKFQEYTILVPMMAEPHFTLIQQVMKDYGYHLEILRHHSPETMQQGLRYVHNDMCYPALIVIGQFLEALESGHYDLDKTALLLPQTGGGCRASNYIFMLRKALRRSGFEKVPVLSINANKLDENTLSLPVGVLIKCAKALLYGDFILCLYNQARSYERTPGDSARVKNDVVQMLSARRLRGNLRENFIEICKMFQSVPRTYAEKPRVGIVGEIYLKYSPIGNNHLEDYLVSRGAEPITSGLTDFLLYCVKNNLIDEALYDQKSWLHPVFCHLLLMARHAQHMMQDIVKTYSNFEPPHTFEEVYQAADGIIDIGTKMGEGWLLSAEIAAYLQHGVNNVVCAQPFGCLPNHIVAKGIMANIREKYPQANVVAVDYDPGACQANQENRLNLMLMNAAKAMRNSKPYDAWQSHPTQVTAAPAV